MEPIYIPLLTKAPDRTEVIPFEQFILDLQTLLPVRGQVRVQHRGNYLDVSGQAEAIVTLTCHRCLQQYNHRLKVECSEIIWLDEGGDRGANGSLERETDLEDLVETLSSEGYFDPQEWIYEQLCLEIPLRQLCDEGCQGIAVDSESEPIPSPPTDRRWAALEELKKQLPS
jgi:uncharacterized protein